jgi:protein-disulfide isomerase
MKSSQFKLLLLLQVITLFLVAMLYLKQPLLELGRPLTDSSAKAMTSSAKVAVRTGDNFIYGNADAENELIIFTRYNCSFCRDFYNESFDSLMANYVRTGELKMVFMDNVNTSDKQGMLMAKLAEMAKAENLYEVLQGRLYAGNAPEDSSEITALAMAVGLNVQQIQKQLNSPEILKAIADDNEEAGRLQLTGTPSFVINGKIITGFRGYPAFKSQLDELIHTGQVKPKS